MMSGIATLCFLLIVKGKVPSYLGPVRPSSAASRRFAPKAVTPRP
jgi:xanthine/uracil permease